MPQAGPGPPSASIPCATRDASSFASTTPPWLGQGMAYETIDFKAHGPVARITLNRPDRLNSFTIQMHEELRDALGSLGDARVLVLTGAGRGFCAGQDLNDRAVAPGRTVDLGETVEPCWNPLIRTLTALPQPVIAR